MTERLPTPCDSCARRITQTTCQAFPKEIPEEIVVWGHNHAVPRPDQKNKLVWVFREGKEEEFENWKDFQEAQVR